MDLLASYILTFWVQWGLNLGHFTLKTAELCCTHHFMVLHYPYISVCGVYKNYLKWWEIQLAVQCGVGKMVQWSMCKELRWKTEQQHTTTVWYNSSCTNKHDKLMETSIQVLSNAKISSFIYWHSILGWYSQPCHEKWTVKIIVDP